MDVILALDPGKRTGVCIGTPGEKPFLCTVNFERDLEDIADVGARALRWMLRIFDGTSPIVPPGRKVTWVVLEAPVPPSGKMGFTNFDTTVSTIGLFFMFRAIIRDAGVPFKLAPINSWRKYALGAGNLKGKDAKAAMMRMVKGLGWGEGGFDHNGAEAAGIWLWACGQAAPERVRRHEPLFSGVMQ